MRVGIVGARQPRLSPAMACGIEAGPRLEARIAWIHRDGVKPPLQRTRLWIEGLQETRHIEIVARSRNDVVADDDRRRGRKVLLLEVGDALVPALLARLRF